MKSWRFEIFMNSIKPSSPDEASAPTAALQTPDPALMTRMYEELRRLAASFLRQERAGHTLQPTALVHEAYLRLIDQTDTTWRDPKRFRAFAATIMRQILVDHARRHGARKRGGNFQRVTLDEAVAPSINHRHIELLTLDGALRRLTALDERQGRVVELRFFGGLTNEEVAEVLGVSRATVANDWTVARAWLSREIDGAK